MPVEIKGNFAEIVPNSLDEELQRLESSRTVNQNAARRLSRRITSLQEELGLLKGQIVQQTFELDKLGILTRRVKGVLKDAPLAVVTVTGDGFSLSGLVREASDSVTQASGRDRRDARGRQRVITDLVERVVQAGLDPNRELATPLDGDRFPLTLSLDRKTSLLRVGQDRDKRLTPLQLGIFEPFYDQPLEPIRTTELRKIVVAKGLYGKDATSALKGIESGLPRPMFIVKRDRQGTFWSLSGDYKPDWLIEKEAAEQKEKEQREMGVLDVVMNRIQRASTIEYEDLTRELSDAGYYGVERMTSVVKGSPVVIVEPYSAAELIEMITPVFRRMVKQSQNSEDVKSWDLQQQVIWRRIQPMTKNPKFTKQTNLEGVLKEICDRLNKSEKSFLRSGRLSRKLPTVLVDH